MQIRTCSIVFSVWTVLNSRGISTVHAFNLEEPLLCFVVNKYVLYSEKLQKSNYSCYWTEICFECSHIIPSFHHTSFSVCARRKSGLIMLVDSKVVAACVPGIGL